MIYEKADQVAYNTKWFQTQFTRDYNISETEKYLTRLLDLNNLVLTKKDEDGFFDTYLSGLEIEYTYPTSDNLQITLSPGRLVIDSVYFEFPSNISLNINPSLLVSNYNDLTLLIVVEYKYDKTVETKAKFRLFILDSLTGNIYPNQWDENSHYMFLEMFNIDKNKRILRPFHRLGLPKCNTEEDLNPVVPEQPEPQIIDYTHSHLFVHEHNYNDPHIHENITIDITSEGGQTIVIEEPVDPVTVEPDLTLPLCSIFFDYSKIDRGKILINGNLYNYYTKWYYAEYVQIFIFHLLNYLTRLYAARTTVDYRMDLMIQNILSYYNGGISNG